jgi:hypothetical protein
MTNLEVQTLSKLLQRANGIVYDAASRQRRADAHDRNLVRLRMTVDKGAKMVAEAQRALGGSSLPRTGERPPRFVDVDTWREFIRHYATARATLYGETGRAPTVVSVGPQASLEIGQEEVSDLSGMAGMAGETRGSTMDAGYVSRQTAALSQAHRTAYSLRERPLSDAQRTAALTELRRQRDGIRYQVNQYASSIGVASAQIAARPPSGVMTADWAQFLATINAASNTLGAAAEPSSGARTSGTAPAGTAPAGTAPAGTAPSVSKPGPAATRGRAGGGRATRQRPAAEPAAITDLPTAAAAAASQVQETASAALDQARGTFEALQTAGRILTGAPNDILQGGITVPLRMVDRLMNILTVLNPPSVGITQRPWFWPATLGITAYVGYKVYQTQVQKKPGAKAAAEKKKLERAPTLVPLAK